MNFSRDFVKITFADFIVRSAYQTGKTPLLPIFAASLGASDAFLGIIVSVSTMTGLVLKPGIGILSDRWGRRLWLIIGTLFFVAMPFLYRFIETPQQLLVMRLIHGTATAIYGPVTLAYIAELRPKNMAESLGWFGMARSGGYIAGPALAGWMLGWTSAVEIYTVIGLISALAIVPVMTLKEIAPPRKERQAGKSLPQQMIEAVAIGAQTPALWLAGSLEMIAFIALYTLKAFLPLYVLAIGMGPFMAGLFFSVQETTTILVKPFGGRLGDRVGHRVAITFGMALLGVGLLLVPRLSGIGLLFPAVITGLAQAFIFPSTVALVSHEITRENLGAGMGFIGMMQNGGKVIGPVLGGFLIGAFSFETVLYLLALLLLLVGAGMLPVVTHTIYTRVPQPLMAEDSP
ncbi:MAG: MFS transporter [Chloroflexi bacterium]|nr:MAG: MFS transporter [Chloroflexota bacterium]